MGVCRDNVTDDQFAARLAGSEPARKAVVEAYERRGYFVHSQPPVKATTFAERGHEDIDLRVWLPSWEDGPDRRVEVKGLSQTFTCRQEWPYSKIIVDEVEKFHEKTPPPWRYVLVSKCLRYAFLVKVEQTQHLWANETMWDRFYKTHIPFYRIEVRHLSVVEL